jgi:hypothetical protein
MTLLAFAALPSFADARTTTTTVKYGWKDQVSYDAAWSAPYGPGEGSTALSNNSITVDAAPFTTSYDFGVFDHLKYIRISSQNFPVPQTGSLEFSVDITALTPGTETGRVIHGCYLESGNWQVGQPCDHPYEQVAREGQQAGVVLNMVDFATGQLFDWFVSSNQVMALIERLPTEVTGSGNVGLDKAYTQLVKTATVKPGSKHTVSIRYSRGPNKSMVEYFLDGVLFTSVNHVGIPLDVQGVPFTGYAPSLGAGEELSINSFSIGHGLFSLLDAFPYQHSERPDLRVSIPTSERIFGQGAIGTWKNFQVTTTSS